MHPKKEEHSLGEDDERSSSLGSPVAAADAEELEPVLPEAQPLMRPPLPPKRLSPSNSLGRSSAPLAGCGRVTCAVEKVSELCNDGISHVRVPTAIVIRRSEDTQSSRLPKSLSSAYLLTASSTQASEPATSNSDGGLPVGVASSHASTVTTAQDPTAVQVWASTQAQVAPAPAAPTPQAEIVTPCPAAATAAAAITSTSTTPTSAPAPEVAAAVATARITSSTTPGSAGTQAQLPHAGGAGGGGGGGGSNASGLCMASSGTAPMPPYMPSRHAASHSFPLADEPLQALAAYVVAEAQPAEKTPTADVVWGQTERERVYNFLLYVPYQLERLIWFGSLLLVDSFVGVFTLLPLRCAMAVVKLVRGAAAALPRRCSTAVSPGDRDSIPGPGPGSGPDKCQPSFSSFTASRAASLCEPPSATASFRTAGIGGAAAATAAAAATGSRPHGVSGGAGQHAARLSGSQLYDLLCLAILVAATAALRAVRPGSIYYWLKDITSEFLKMSVLSTAFDMLDKILSNFGNDVLEALSGTCTQWLAGKKRLWQLGADALVAGVIVTLHALTLMCQALIVAVALNSSRNGLVALLIANNFVEIKSTVFKKWDSTRIWALVCADAVERFHLLVVLSFVVVEEMDSAASWSPPPDYLRVCGLMVAAEVVIDVIKHAVLGKFNEVRPGLYREFHQDLCAKALQAQSHSAPRLLNFHHLAPAALAMRILVTLFWLRVETRAQVWPRLLVVAVLYGVLLGVKLLFGYCIKVLAHYNSRYYYRKYGGKAHSGRPPAASRMGTGTVTGHLVAPPAVGSGLVWGATASAPLPHGSGQAMPSPSPSSVPAATAAAGAAEAGTVPSGDSFTQSMFSQSLMELQAAMAAVGAPPAAAAGSRAPPSPRPLHGGVPRRLSGPAAGVGAAGTGQTGAGSGLTAALLASFSGLGAGGVVSGVSSGHAKVE